MAGGFFLGGRHLKKKCQVIFFIFRRNWNWEKIIFCNFFWAGGFFFGGGASLPPFFFCMNLLVRFKLEYTLNFIFLGHLKLPFCGGSCYCSFYVSKKTKSTPDLSLGWSLTIKKNLSMAQWLKWRYYKQLVPLRN